MLAWLRRLLRRFLARRAGTPAPAGGPPEHWRKKVGKVRMMRGVALVEEAAPSEWMAVHYEDSDRPSTPGGRVESRRIDTDSESRAMYPDAAPTHTEPRRFEQPRQPDGNRRVAFRRPASSGETTRRLFYPNVERISSEAADFNAPAASPARPSAPWPVPRGRRSDSQPPSYEGAGMPLNPGAAAFNASTVSPPPGIAYPGRAESVPSQAGSSTPAQVSGRQKRAYFRSRRSATSEPGTLYDSSAAAQPFEIAPEPALAPLPSRPADPPRFDPRVSTPAAPAQWPELNDEIAYRRPTSFAAAEARDLWPELPPEQPPVPLEPEWQVYERRKRLEREQNGLPWNA